MTFWREDARRLLTLLVTSSTLGLLANMFSAHPVSLLSSSGPGAWPQIEPRITVEQLREEIVAGRLVLILDVRNESAYKADHPAGAIHAPAEVFLDSYKSLGLSRTLKAADRVVVMCDSASCPSADRVARLLDSLGHRDIRVLQGGWKAYSHSRLDGR